LDALEPQIAELDAELHRLSTVAPWVEPVPYLMQIPGFGIQVTMTVLAAIGDISRFPTAKQLVGYAGLGAGVHDSGETHRGGGITKQGRKDLRFVLIEAARIAVVYHAHWKHEYARLEKRLGSNKAIVAIARRLLIGVWHVWSKRVADRHVAPQMLAHKLLQWSRYLTEGQRGGLTTRQFIRYQMMRLKVGDDVTHVRHGINARPLATVDEVLALHPELKSGA
jgi:hypothetical protein